MEKKESKGMIVLVVILIILLLGAVGYICYDKFLVKENNAVNNDKVQEDKKLSEDEINILNATLIIDGTDANLFASSNINIDNIDDTQLISYVITKYGEENNWQTTLINFDNTSSEEEFHKVASVSMAEIVNMIKEIFNADKSFELKDKSYYDYNCWGVWYSKDDDMFYLDASSGGAEFGTKKIFLKKYEQDENNVYVYNKLINCHYSSGQCYFTNEKTISVDTDVSILKNEKFDYEYIIDKYGDKFNTYKSVFKKASDGKYYWYSSEIVNE